MLGTGECVPREMSESESVSVGESGASPRRGVSEVAPDPESGGWLCLEYEQIEKKTFSYEVIRNKMMKNTKKYFQCR